MNARTMYGKCLRKKVFRTYDFACKRAAEITKESGIPMYVYWCKLCGYYHLTKQKQK